MQELGSMIRSIITDIEGTTSSLSFVKDILFPYASANLESFIENNENNIAVQNIIQEVTGSDSSKNPVSILKDWIKLDLKLKPLKDLQGLIWESGYNSGAYQGHIYDDAYYKLVDWHKQGIKLYIYSSGSVFAQKLLFGHTKFGDLNYLFSGYFDTRVGHKREPASYINILTEIKEAPEDVIFLSDIREELEAAADTGIQVVQLVRDAKASPSAEFKQLESFTEIII